jgi:hypothetical protein
MLFFRLMAGSLRALAAGPAIVLIALLLRPSETLREDW